MSTRVGIIGSFHITQMHMKTKRRDEGIIFLYVIITGYIIIFEKVCVPFAVFHVHFQDVLINLINNGYKIVIHQLNKDIPTLKDVTILKYLGITKIVSS